MNFLLAPPPMLDKPTPPPRSPPKTLLSIASNFEEKNVPFYIIDGFLERKKFQRLRKRISDLNPDRIYIAPFDYSRFVPFKTTYRLARQLENEVKSDIGFIWSYRKDFLKGILESCESFDFAVLGDPEPVLKEVHEKDSFRDVEGVVYREGGEIASNGKKLIDNLDKLPFLRWELLPYRKYRVMPHRYKNKPSFEVMASRGCPFNCKFCFHKFFPRKRRSRSPENVVREVKRLKERYGAEDVRFDDPIFGLKNEWLKEFCDRMDREKVDISWSCQKRIDTTQTELLPPMKEAGCWSILYGIESASQDCLEKINKKIEVERAEKIINFTKKVGIEAVASFILGLPGETPQRTRKTIDFAKKLNPDYAQFFLCKTFNNKEYFQRYGKVKDWKFEDYDFRGPVFIPRAYEDLKELKRMKRKAYREFYLRPKYILERLKRSDLRDVKRLTEGIETLRQI